MELLAGSVASVGALHTGKASVLLAGDGGVFPHGAGKVGKRREGDKWEKRRKGESANGGHASPRVWGGTREADSGVDVLYLSFLSLSLFFCILYPVLSISFARSVFHIGL